MWNLGLSFLRGHRLVEAMRQFEIAVDLNPEHRKAIGYMGLALLEGGDPLRAREWFRRSGSEQMVARCDQLLGKAATDAQAAPAEATGTPSKVSEPAAVAAPLAPEVTPEPVTGPSPEAIGGGASGEARSRRQRRRARGLRPRRRRRSRGERPVRSRSPSRGSELGARNR